MITSRLSEEDLRTILGWLEPKMDVLVHAYLSRQVPFIMQAMVEDILAKQRKDVADELVRILLEKALEKK